MARKEAVVIGLYLLAVGLQALCAEGEAHFRAGNYPRAVEIYQKALGQPLSREQGNLLRYDLATAQLAAGDARGALASYRQIDLGLDPEPQLARAVCIGRVRAALESDSLKVLAEAVEDWHGASMAEREAMEESSQELQELWRALKERVAAVAARLERERLEALEPPDVVEELVGGIRWTMEHLERYGEVLSQPLALWQQKLSVYWERLELPEARSAENLHRRAKERLEEGQVWPARDDLAEALHHLTCLRWSLEAADPLEEVLAKREEGLRRRMTADSALSAALEKEVNRWSFTGARLCRAAGWERLERRLLTEADPHSAIVDQWIYRQLFESREQSVADLYRDVRDGHRKATWGPRLEALELAIPLEVSHLEQALRELNPRTWLDVKLTEWEVGDAPAVAADERRCLEHCRGLFPSVEQAVEQSAQAFEAEASCAPLARSWVARAQRLLHQEVVDSTSLLRLGIEQQGEVESFLRQEGSLSERAREIVLAREQGLLDEVADFPALLTAEGGEDQEVLALFDRGVRAGKSLWVEVAADAAEESRKIWEEILKGEGGSDSSQEPEDGPSEESEEEEQVPRDAMEWLQQMDREDEGRAPARLPRQGLRPW